MAKAKKTTPTPDATAPAAAPKKKTAAKAKPAGASSSPMVDTTLAAQSAARGLVAGLGPTGAYSAGKESASFKHLKDSLAHPASAGLDSLLDKTALPNSRKSNVPFTGPKTGGGSGRNQTFGADVNRTGVPRRTSGG